MDLQDYVREILASERPCNVKDEQFCRTYIRKCPAEPSRHIRSFQKQLTGPFSLFKKQTV